MTNGSQAEFNFAYWYIDEWGHTTYDLAETEGEAAWLAAWADGEGAALGLQRSDGSVVPIAEWPAFAKAVREVREAERARREAASPPPTRKAHDPFGGQVVYIETADPAWLGRAENEQTKQQGDTL